MSSQLSAPLLAKIYQVSQHLPAVTLQSVVQILQQKDLPPTVLSDRLSRQLPKASWRQMMSELLEICSQETANPPLSTVAAMLSTTAYCQKRFQEELSLEFVWTGPVPEGSSFRRTDQALLELIRDAQETLTIVSFAVYKIPEIMDALQQSIMRGVSLTFIFEVPEASDGKIAYNVASSIHSKLLGQAKLLNWAKDKRPVDSEGKTGSLHAKFAIADHQKIFVSSANLTHYAMTLNIEMGVLIHGSSSAREAVEHIDRLIAEGNFVTYL